MIKVMLHNIGVMKACLQNGTIIRSCGSGRILTMSIQSMKRIYLLKHFSWIRWQFLMHSENVIHQNLKCSMTISSC
jgi:hypothetical protein